MEEYLRRSLHLAAAGRPLVFVDTETTGLIRNGQKPVAWQIGYLRRNSRRQPESEIQSGEANLNIGEFLDPDICRICKVEADHPMRAGRNPVEILDRLAEHLDGAILVGHNYDEFDYQILRFTYERYHLPIPAELRHAGVGYSMDTLTMSRLLLKKGAPGSPEAYNNSAIARHFGVPVDESVVHSALADARVTMGVFDHLIDLCEKQFRDELFRADLVKRAPPVPKPEA